MNRKHPIISVRDYLLPVVEGGGRCDDEEGSPHPVCLGHIRQEGEGLHGLAQPHLVSQDAVDALVIEGTQPVHALQLVGLQGALLNGDFRINNYKEHK